MSLIKFFTHRRRSIFTAGTDAVRANTWRPAVELWPAAAWSLTAAAALSMTLTAMTPPVPALPMGLAAGVLGTLRLRSALGILKDRAALAGSALELISSRSFARRLLRARRDMAGKGNNETFAPVWFGRGFDWGPEHAQKLYELSKIDVNRLLPARAFCKLLTDTEPKDSRTVGLSAIDGLESRKKDIWVSEKTLEGGTLIVGTTQAGKGVLLTSLVTQAILRGEAVIVIDPKMSSRLQNAVTAAAKLARRSPPLFFHPNHPEGLRINPLTHFERPSEIASRITAVMSDSGPFTSFAWSAVNVVVDLLVHVGRTPSIATIEAVLTGDFEDLLLEAAELDCGEDYFDMLVSEAKVKGKKGRDGVLDVLERAKTEGEALGGHPQRRGHLCPRPRAFFEDHGEPHAGSGNAHLRSVATNPLASRRRSACHESFGNHRPAKDPLCVPQFAPGPDCCGRHRFDASCRPRLLRGRTLQQHVHLPKHCQSLRRRVLKHD